MANSNTKELLEDLLPYSLIATRKWLVSHGLNRHSFDNAVKSRKLEPLTSGVYKRYGGIISWQSIICSIQKMSNNQVHIGGLTALSLLGLSHYISSSEEKVIHLYSNSTQPTWLSKLELKTQFKWHKTKTLWTPKILEEKKLLRSQNWTDGLPPLLVSCPEKAYLEILFLVPNKISFEHADQLTQGLTSLSPKKLKILLTDCRNIKVKRLFFWFSERQNYSWFKKLDSKDFNLGKGKRLIEKNGKLDNKYLITVPENLYETK